MRRFWQVCVAPYPPSLPPQNQPQIHRQGPSVRPHTPPIHQLIPHSEDHRGTPHHPGRVVTLIASPPSPAQDPLPRVWGAAYRIPAAHAVAARAHLDHREINGYSVQTALFHLRDEVDGDGDGDGKGAAREETSIECLVYVGLPTNPQFLGPQEPQALAERISRCRGPSGANVEYLYRLHEALAAVGGGDDDDDHVADLVRRCRELDARESADCPA